MFTSVLANTALKRELTGSLFLERFFHAYLFTGPLGMGKRTVAFLFAKAILCNGENRPCNQCISCQLFSDGNHPNFLQLSPQNGKISVQMIRDLLSELNKRPFHPGWRVVLLQNVDLYNASCQNALLKTLEDPPEKTVFLLTAQNSELLLPTVRSRLRILRMGPVEEEEMVSYLCEKGIDMMQARKCAQVSGGNLGYALTLSKDTDYWEMRESCLKIMQSIHNQKDVLSAWQKIKDFDKIKQQQFLDQCEVFNRSLLSIKTGAPLVLPERQPLDQLASCFTIQAIHDMIEVVIVARKRLFANVSWQSSIEGVLTSFGNKKA